MYVKFFFSSSHFFYVRFTVFIFFGVEKFNLFCIEFSLLFVLFFQVKKRKNRKEKKDFFFFGS